MSKDTSQPITQLLIDMRGGNRAIADRLLPLVYDEMKSIARRFLKEERSNHTLQATALVHEAYLRLVDQRRTGWQDRAHFLAIAAKMIRRVLVDHARRRSAVKRGEGRSNLELNDSAEGLANDPGQPNMVDLLALEEALVDLARLNERQARVVELRFFGGLSIDESAEVLGISPRSVDGDWHMGRAWLRLRLGAGAS